MRVACIAELGYPDHLGDEGLAILIDSLRDRRVDLLVVIGVSSRPDSGIVEYVVSEIVDGLEAAVSVLPGECDVAAIDVEDSWIMLRSFEHAVRRAGGHPLHSEPLVTNGLGVAGVPVLRGGGCNGLERWGLPRDHMEDYWAGRLARLYSKLVEEYRPPKRLLVVGGGGTPLLVAKALAVLDGVTMLVWRNECIEPLNPLVFSV